MFNHFRKFVYFLFTFLVFQFSAGSVRYDDAKDKTTQFPTSTTTTTEFITIRQTYTPWEELLTRGKRRGAKTMETTTQTQDILERYDEYINNTKREIGDAPPVRLFNTAPFRMIWVDLELTGLDLEKDTILEIACVITENNMKIVAQTGAIVVSYPEEVLRSMGPWCLAVHSTNGLINESLSSDLTIESADAKVYNFLKKYTPRGRCCLVGNSVYFDQYFIDKYLPLTSSHIQKHRIIDVSTVNELVRRWHHDVFQKLPRKFKRHRALDDILESIGELRMYKDLIFGTAERQLKMWTPLYDLTSTFEPTRQPAPPPKYPNRTRRTTTTTENFWEAMLTQV